ncbi:kinase-like domain-containing protein [Protomyces lactucae-debilis]|uniref:non-specific serine/threonine protein kinase n=1 Tax=Protomyces lactucae-debilis TaxID=2754530 RepID=A0A1Y2F8X0_PROLT|nr:kinase-like domain-containing protein [Protomyces lactucae-debilis]ORY80313.1 kinase-like domain-containing protein [Protomyces lactucae-debilis]
MAVTSAQDFVRQEVIGRGSYGIVYRGQHKESGALVAIKVLNLDTVEDEVSDIQKEIVLLQSLKSGDAQNVVKYHGSFLNGMRLWIIMDYCEGGSIRTLMKCGRIEEKYIVIIVREVLAALIYIHKSHMIHRDLKAANILVTNDGRVQLCDFGVAAQLAANHFKRNTFVGTPYWMAPEVISDGLSYNYKADIWSLGITIYEIATGNPPHADQEPMRAIFLIPRSQPPRLEGPQFSSALKEFIAACLCEKPEERLPASELLKLKVIKQTAKTPTSILKELVARYEAWRKSGGVRQSIAIQDDLADEDFDGKFGLDDDIGNGQDGWDFGTARKPMKPPRLEMTWEQSASATEDLLKTIKPTTREEQRQLDHPLLKLFGEVPSTEAAETIPQTPIAEPLIEMPAMNATSLATASSISLPFLQSEQTPPMSARDALPRPVRQDSASSVTSTIGPSSRQTSPVRTAPTLTPAGSPSRQLGKPLVLQSNGSTQSLPEAMPRMQQPMPNSKREGMHIRKPSNLNLVLTTPSSNGGFQWQSSDLSLASPARVNMSNGHGTAASTPTTSKPPMLPPLHVPTNGKVESIQPLEPLNLSVLANEDADAVVEELDKVIVGILDKLLAVENNLSAMSLKPSAS